jgi:MobA/VirD2-like, nuclease domain
MVAKIISGKTLEGAIRYNEHKVSLGKAELIQAKDFTKDKEILTLHDKVSRLHYLAAKNKRVKTNTVHISLNFDPKEYFLDEKLNQIANTYMEKIGFGDQPYLVYRHDDVAHLHIHIVTTNIDREGKRISLHNIGRNQSEQARKEIEKQFGLIPAESKKQQQALSLKPVELKKVMYGKSQTKAAISGIVREVVSTYKFTSLPELNAILNQFNVTADRGPEGSRMHEKNGLVYSLLDEKGNKIGVPIKASAIYSSPTLKVLEKKFAQNELAKKPYKQRVKGLIDRELNNACITVKKFTEALHRKGIEVVFRRNKEGYLYGITYVDHATKVVFNGSSLGKAYSAKAITEKIGDHTAANNINQHDQTSNGHQLLSNDNNLATGKIMDILFPGEHEEQRAPDPYKKKKKKKRIHL